MLRKRQIILAKVESAYGSDPTPVENTNAILAEIASIKIGGRTIERNNVQTYFGQNAPVNVGESLELEFITELKGSGVVATAPEIGVLFRGCNFTETITPATSVVYDPNSNSSTAESLTFYFYIDGIRFKLLGARGSFSVDLKAGEYGKITWKFSGLYAIPTDTAIVTGTYNSTVPPRFLSAAFALHSYAAVFEALSIDIGNEIVKRVSSNAATGVLEYLIMSRNVTGKLDPEAVLVATKDWYTIWGASTRSTLTTAVGATAGNICTITGPKVALSGLDLADRSGILTHDMALVFSPNTGNDEIKFAFT